LWEKSEVKANISHFLNINDPLPSSPLSQKNVKDSILPRKSLGEGAGDDHAEAEWRMLSNEETPRDSAWSQDTEVTNDLHVLATA